MATQVQNLQDIKITMGSAFFGKLYFQKWRDTKDTNTGEMFATVICHGENHREQVTVKIPLANVNQVELDQLPLHAVIDFENVTGKFWASTSGDFTNVNLSAKAEKIVVLKPQGQAQPQGQSK